MNTHRPNRLRRRSVALALSLVVTLGFSAPAARADPGVDPDPYSVEMITTDVASVGVRVADDGAFITPDNVSIQPDSAGNAFLYQDGEALGPVVAMATGEVAKLNPLTHRLTAGNTHGVSPAVNCNCHWTWGWVSGTLYFNKLGTNVIRTGGAGLSGMLARIPMPFAVGLRAAIGTLTVIATIAVAQGTCLKVKSYGQISGYTGGFCK